MNDDHLSVTCPQDVCRLQLLLVSPGCLEPLTKSFVGNGNVQLITPSVMGQETSNPKYSTKSDSMLYLGSICCCNPCLCCRLISIEKVFSEPMCPLAQKGHLFYQPLQLILLLHCHIRKMKIPVHRSSQIWKFECMLWRKNKEEEQCSWKIKLVKQKAVLSSSTARAVLVLLCCLWGWGLQGERGFSQLH